MSREEVSTRERCDRVEEFEKVFNTISGGKKILSKEYIGTVLRLCGFHPSLKEITVYENLIEVEHFDFEKLCWVIESQKRKHKRKRSVVLSVNRIFGKLDQGSRGYISVEDLKKLLMTEGETLFDEEFDIPMKEYFGVRKEAITKMELTEFLNSSINF